jgi:hypothetical protein
MKNTNGIKVYRREEAIVTCIGKGLAPKANQKEK